MLNNDINIDAFKSERGGMRLMSSSKKRHLMSGFPKLAQSSFVSERASMQDVSRLKALNEQLLLKGLKIIAKNEAQTL